MQPNDPYNRPEQGGQYPQGQYPSGQYPPQGGAHPSGGYAPPPNVPPAYHTGPGAVQPASGKMPGTVLAARVLMFIGGVSGLLIGALIWLAAVTIAGDPQISGEMESALAQAGLAGQIGTQEVIGMLGLVGAIPFGYGLVSTLLAAFMGKRTPVLLWATVVFQAVAGALLILAVVGGGVLSLVPLLFTVGIIVLMIVPVSRAFYSPVPQGYGPGPQY